MKIKSLFAALLLSLFMTITVAAGDMPGPGFAENPPKSEPPAPTAVPCAPGLSSAGGASACQEATPNLAIEAMIFAIQLLSSGFR